MSGTIRAMLSQDKEDRSKDEKGPWGDVEGGEQKREFPRPEEHRLWIPSQLFWKQWPGGWKIPFLGLMSPCLGSCYGPRSVQVGQRGLDVALA